MALLDPSDNQHEDNARPQQGVDILWEEPSAMVINKPAGILTQGAAGLDTMETRLRSYLKHRDYHSGIPYVGMPHRLDRCVSGTLLIARNLRAVQRFGAQFQHRKVTKIYWAIAAGHVPSPSNATEREGEIGYSTESTTWRDFIRKIPERPVAEIVTGDEPGAKSAVLHYRVVRYLPTIDGRECTWVEVQLETGRMHQIRLQFASRGFPLLGDSMYGSDVAFGPYVADPREKAIALHAREIRFFHPKTGVQTTVTADVFMQNQSVRLVRPASTVRADGWELIAGL